MTDEEILAAERTIAMNRLGTAIRNLQTTVGWIIAQAYLPSEVFLKEKDNEHSE